MKKMLSFLAPLLLTPILLMAQKTDYKVVFDLTTKDPAVHQTVVRWINAITKETPDAQLEVVFYGQSLDMIRTDKSTLASDITALARNNNVSFAVCEIAMKRHNIDKSQLLPGVKTVPDGIYELVSRQKQGWGYIKVSQ
jgi:intracellular sulfur oxidation DsrE/DsrF family protein